MPIIMICDFGDEDGDDDDFYNVYDDDDVNTFNSHGV